MSNEDKYAFPFDCNFTQYTGMALRDYFAAKVIDGLLDHHPTVESAAEHAYKVADAMMEARDV